MATVTFSPAQPFTVAKTAQSVTFDPLLDSDYGEPAFAVFATASQAGDSNYLAAAPVARTFAVSDATQAITFGPAPAGVTVGQPLVFVSATSTSPTAAPSTMPITFTSLTPSICTMGGADANASLVTLVAVGQCTIAAVQAGDANYNGAPQTTLTFPVGPAGPPPATFTVTNLNNSGPGSLRAAIASANATAPGPNLVNFASALTGTIVLTTGQIQISRSVLIDGPGADNLTIDGNGASTGNGSTDSGSQMRGASLPEAPEAPSSLSTA